MQIETYIDALIDYAIERGLCQAVDRQVLQNRLMEILRLDAREDCDEPRPEALEEILKGLLDYACKKGLCEDNITARDLFDTKLMGALTPMPSEVIAKFNSLYRESPEKATQWYYSFSQDTDYIRRYRVKKDLRWVYDSPYGRLDITINLSKPEKDPKAIAAAKLAPQSNYPKCQLCRENEGYAGRMNHPARQNHRIIPISLAGCPWYLQYSPYVYYNEHCIVFNEQHIPMKVDRGAFDRMLDFVTAFPHYFVGSNADLPIVGGSILSHDHFQGGNYTFAMAKAPIEIPLSFPEYPGIRAGIVKWPMSVIRLTGADPVELAELSEKLLSCWRQYSDPSAGIVAFSDGEPHNTVTPIARRQGADYQMDLVLRCNITTAEHPLGLFHPHADKHHIKKENIGLIEVMGLAVLPSRLKTELLQLKEAILNRAPLTGELEKHAPWAKELMQRCTFTEENAMDILTSEVGRVFSEVLEDAGVFKCTPQGREAFLRFTNSL